ncbi:UNVERIFIED_CONTAM: alpha-(1-_3)-arabinofuranosyltransferase family protein, partial [Bacteroidetes bacterium 56_B9]
MALASALAILALGAVNAVATAVVVVPAALWWLASFANPAERKTAAYFGAWWVPAGIAASFWWV